jgi:cyanophycin synthetase
MPGKRSERVEPGEQPRLHVGHAGSVGSLAIYAKRPLGGGSLVEHGVHVADEQQPRPGAGFATEVADDRRTQALLGIGPSFDFGTDVREESSDEPTDLVDSLRRVAPAVDVDEALEIGEEGAFVSAEIRLDRLEFGVADHVAGRRVGLHGGQSTERRACYSRRTVRAVEIRLLEGPNVYRLEPVVKVEVAVGRRRTWYGQRTPGRHALVRLGAAVPRTAWPAGVESLVDWIRRLRVDAGENRGGVTVHRSSDPGHWIVAFPWEGAERAHTLAEAAFALAERDVSSARRARLTGGQERALARWQGRIADARTTPPSWIRDADRRVPVVSITGTNGKSTVTRLVTHILVGAGRRVGTTTSDGVLVNERMVDPGDWTGPGGAQQILNRSDLDVAVLETARGGIVLRGIGYESNEVSVITNVSSDHLDLQGIHTLPELAEVKATVARVTRADGWSVLNADDPLVAAIARRVSSRVALFSLVAGGSAAVRRAVEGGARGYVVRDGWVTELSGRRSSRIVEAAGVPITIGGLARHNVANVLAAAAAARGLELSTDQVAEGLLDFRPTSDRSPGRLNLYRLGARIVIVDFAHNEAGVAAILDVAEGIGAGAAGRAAPVTAIVGTAGDRPDDTLRGIARIAAERAQRVAIKETLHYLRGRSRESVVGELLAGIRSAGRSTADVPVYESETAALRGELSDAEGRPRVIVLLCHEEREEVFRLLDGMGARPIDVATELTSLVPRLQERPRRH